MGHMRRRLDKLEERAFEGYGVLQLPDGTKITYGPDELLDALLAQIDCREHRLLPVLRRFETNEGLLGLIRALEPRGDAELEDEGQA
jgi:hypothetical protein